MPATPTEIVINAANEGIPVTAIARVTRQALDEIYEQLHEAKDRGAIIELPRADWPPGVRVQDRLPSASLPQDSDLQFMCGKAFRLTQLEAGFLVALLKHRQVEKTRLHGIVEHQRQHRNPNDHDPTDPKMVDVMICKLRKKLKTIDPALKIETVWGSGYYIEPTLKPNILAHLDRGAPDDTQTPKATAAPTPGETGPDRGPAPHAG